MENREVRTGGEHIVAQALETVLLEKVDKEEGMGLSSSDYTAAEKAKLAGLENYSLPDFTYRNLCCNSRGDNLNSWEGWSTADKVAIDTVKFGRPVIQLTNQYQGPTWWIGLIVDENCPDLKQYIGTGVPLSRPVTVSYDMWCNYAVEVRAWHESTDVVTIAANKFQRVKHTIPAGTVLENIGVGISLVEGRYDLEAYYEHVQVEWGTEASPYCYNATLPMSLQEQIVPGEFWDGKQVYQRSFKGMTPEVAGQSVTLATGIDTILDVRASVANSPYNSLPPAMIYEISGSMGTDLIYQIYSFNNSAVLYPYGSRTRNMTYTVMLKYTKS